MSATSALALEVIGGGKVFIGRQEEKWIGNGLPRVYLRSAVATAKIRLKRYMGHLSASLCSCSCGWATPMFIIFIDRL